MIEPLTFASLGTSAKRLSAQVIMDSADFVFHLWPDGSIKSARISSISTEPGLQESLSGTPIAELFHSGCQSKVSVLIKAARDGLPPQATTLRHSAFFGAQSHARYAAHLADDLKNIIIIGQMLSADQMRLEEIVKAEISQTLHPTYQGSVERYKHLFQTSVEGLMMVNARTGLIEETNRRAATMLGAMPEDLLGSQLSEYLAPMTGAAHRLPTDGGMENVDRLPVFAKRTESQALLSSQTIRGQQQSLMVVRLSPITAPALSTPQRATIALLRNIAFPVVMANAEGVLDWTNLAFADLFRGQSVLGQPVSTLLSISNAAFELAKQQADAHGGFLTSLSALDGELPNGGDARVAIVCVDPDDTSGYGIIFQTLRPAPAGNPVSTSGGEVALTDLVGTMPMKSLVRRTTDVIEARCIEAALRLTGNNRAAAAEVLGMSRQNLYIKLHQFKQN